jgi:HEAT repeat protein
MSSRPPARPARPARLRALSTLSMLALMASGAGRLDGQSVADRVAAAGNGVIRMAFTARADACGDGGDMVGLRGASGRHLAGAPEDRFRFLRTGSDRNTFSGEVTGIGDRCVYGPVRVQLDISGGRASAVETHVAGQWPAPPHGTHDLGRVPAADAAGYLLGIAATTPSDDAASDAMAASVLADSARSASGLRRLALDGGLDADRRRGATFWLGHADDPVATPALGDILRQGDTARLRKAAIFALSQRPEPQARAMVIAAVRNDGLEQDVRKSAIFWTGQTDVPVDTLAAFYHDLGDRALREQVIFALSQRSEPRAVDQLMNIAQHDGDITLRKKAIFWLGQSSDPRAMTFLRRLILGPEGGP